MIFDIEYVAKTSYSVEADCLELALEKADRLVLADKEFSAVRDYLDASNVDVYSNDGKFLGNQILY